MIDCPCGSQKCYLSCCEPFLTGTRMPGTPEMLMRSRYTAYTMANIDYIKNTMCGQALLGFQEEDAKRWAKRVNWIKLIVFESAIKNSNTGMVEFEARFVDGSRLKLIHEKSEFILEKGRWSYVGGIQQPTAHLEQLISRTMHCPCGSHRKFKNCHGK